MRSKFNNSIHLFELETNLRTRLWELSLRYLANEMNGKWSSKVYSNSLDKVMSLAASLLFFLVAYVVKYIIHLNTTDFDAK